MNLDQDFPGPRLRCRPVGMELQLLQPAVAGQQDGPHQLIARQASSNASKVSAKSSSVLTAATKRRTPGST